VSLPTVSIIVAVHNGARVLLQALEALRRNTESGYELILVENGSTDDSADFVRQAEDATVVHNTRNLGFGVASNQGATRARGRHLLFLNQDAFVQPGWLPPLLDRIETDLRIGAVGPKLLAPDGSLQCAGALLSRSGSANCYGTGDDPKRAEYGSTRVVDYLAGACLLVRRSAFHDVGGFDAAYGLAYFEDADLCLSLAANRYRCVYEPRSRVTHVFGRPSEPIMALALRNRALFERRWRRVLAARPLSPLSASPRRTISARDTPALAAEDRDAFAWS